MLHAHRTAPDLLLHTCDKGRRNDVSCFSPWHDASRKHERTNRCCVGLQLCFKKGGVTVPSAARISCFSWHWQDTPKARCAQLLHSYHATEGTNIAHIACSLPAANHAMRLDLPLQPLMPAKRRRAPRTQGVRVARLA